MPLSRSVPCNESLARNSTGIPKNTQGRNTAKLSFHTEREYNAKYLADIAAAGMHPQLLDQDPQGLPSQHPQQLPGEQLLLVLKC